MLEWIVVTREIKKGEVLINTEGRGFAKCGRKGKRWKREKMIN